MGWHVDFSPIHTALPTLLSFPRRCLDDSTDASEKAFVERLNGCLMTLARKVEAKPEVSWPGLSCLHYASYPFFLPLLSSQLPRLGFFTSTSSTDITNDLNKPLNLSGMIEFSVESSQPTQPNALAPNLTFLLALGLSALISLPDPARALLLASLVLVLPCYPSALSCLFTWPFLVLQQLLPWCPSPTSSSDV